METIYSSSYRNVRDVCRLRRVVWTTLCCCIDYRNHMATNHLHTALSTFNSELRHVDTTNNCILLSHSQRGHLIYATVTPDKLLNLTP